VNAARPATPNVLLIDDDADLAAMLSDTLGARGYRVWHATTAAEADQVLDQAQPDLIIVDLMLPDRNGLVLCASLRERIGVPLIICSATKRKEDPVLGLKLGADDFIAKPFSVDELEARLEATLQRPRAGPPRATPAVQHIGSLVIDRAECRAALGEHPLALTPTEFRLLCAIAERPHQVVSREALADQVWGEHDDAIVRSLAVHMRRLRSKLQAVAAPGPRLATRRGFGYQLLEDDSASRRALSGQRSPGPGGAPR
jgi:DNA-binding response OmpR family regulator